MVVLFVSRFKKDLKNAPKNVQKKVLETIEKLEAAENLEKSGLDYRKIEGQKRHEQLQDSHWRLADRHRIYSPRRYTFESIKSG